MSKSVGYKTSTNQFRLSSFRFNRSLSQNKQKRPRSVSQKKRTYQMSLTEQCMMTQIKKAVRANDVTLLLGNRHNKLRTQTDCHNETKQTIVHQQLIQVRKKYDNIKRQRAAKFTQNEKLKEKMKTMQIRQDQYKQSLEKTKQFNTIGGQKLQVYRAAIEQNMMDKKVLQNMRHRLYQDVVLHKKRIVEKKNNLERMFKQLKLLKKQYPNIVNQAAIAQSITKKMQNQIMLQQAQRQEHLESKIQKINQYKRQVQQKDDWNLFKNQAAVDTLQAKDEEEKGWQKLLLSHLFVKSILKQKITLEMNKFEVVERTFGNIKSRTEAKDTQQFIYRFLNREHIYGNLLGQVTQCKKKVQQLKKEQERLINQNQKLQNIKQEIENIVYFSHSGHFGIQEEKQMIQWKLRVQNLQQLKVIISEWAVRQSLKLGKVYKKWFIDSTQSLPRTNNQLKSKLLQFLMRIKQAVEQIQKENNIIPLQLMDNQPYFEQYRDQCQIQNIPKYVSNTSQLLNGSQLMNNSSQIAPVIKKRKQSQSYRVEDQVSNLDFQRDNLINKNQKFMNEARTRIMQAKRLKVEKQSQLKKF